VVHTLDPEGAVATREEDAWEVAALMPEGLEHSAVHRCKLVKGKRSGRDVEH